MLVGHVDNDRAMRLSSVTGYLADKKFQIKLPLLPNTTMGASQYSVKCMRSSPIGGRPLSRFG